MQSDSQDKSPYSDMRMISVDVYDPEQGDYRTAGYILLRKGTTGFVYSRHYDGPALDPINLPINTEQTAFKPKSGTLHDVFKDTLPGHWGARQLTEENPDYAQQSDVEQMFWLGSRTSRGLRFRCFKAPGIESPIRGIKLLKEIEKRSIDYILGKNEKGRPVYDKETRWAVVSGGGARPKAQCRFKGIDMIAKFNVPHDPYNLAKVEHSMLQLSSLAGLQTPTSHVLKGEDNEDVFLVERYDRMNGQRQHTLSLATLAGRDNTSQGNVAAADYIDVVEILNKASDDPEADRQEIYGRMMFAAMCNITDNHLRNYEVMLYPDGKYRLSPNFDLVPDPWNTPFATHLCRYTRGDMPDFLSLRFVDNASKRMGLSEEQGREISRRVASSLLEHRDQVFTKNELSDDDRRLMDKAMDPERLKALVCELNAAMTDDQKEQASRTLR